MSKNKDIPSDHKSSATEVVHSGRNPFEHHGFVNVPVYRGSTVLFPNLETLEKQSQTFTYARHGTPTVRALEDAISQLEFGHATKLTPSGYQAITTAILAFVESGQHILVTDNVYEPTRHFCDYILKRMGIETEYYDPLIGSGIAQLVRPNTSLIYVESPGSLTFEIQDIPAIAKVAHEKNLWLIADNTWATPLFCNPLTLGADVSIHSATKYLVGHADALLGTITSNERASKHLEKAYRTLGVCAGSEEIFLGLRGLRTLSVRLEKHQNTGLELAQWLSARSEILNVIHPALPSHKQHLVWKRDFKGSNGLFTVILKPVPKTALAAFLDGLKVFTMGFSWGGFESLVIPFNTSKCRTATSWKIDGQ
ncbi:MAG: cystathionine beta-lyase, partial [Hyphomicrobium sp.]